MNASAPALNIIIIYNCRLCDEFIYPSFIFEAAHSSNNEKNKMLHSNNNNCEDYCISCNCFMAINANAV